MRKGTITENGVKIKWNQTEDGISYADGKDAIPSPDNMDAKIAYKAATYPIIDLPPVVVESVTNVDHIYIAAKSIVSNGSAVSIPDQVSGIDLKYSGVNKPVLTGKPPIIENGEICFDNEPHTSYVTSQFPVKSYPYEITIVGRRLPGTEYEQYLNDWNGDITIGDAGNALRSGDGNIPSQVYPNSSINFYEVFVIHVLAESEKQTMWLNGTKLGAVKTRGNSRRVLNSIGVDTNNAQWNFIAEYIKNSKFSDNEREKYLAMVNDYHGAGLLPSAPYASKVQFHKSDKYTAQYTYNGKIPEDKSKVQYRWIGLGSGGLGATKILGTGSMLPLSAAYGVDSIRVEVKVFDTSGKSFRYISMEFTDK